MTTPDTATSQRCAWCEGPLPAPIEALAVVHGSGGAIMTTCCTACLAELVAILAGPAAAKRRAASRRN